MMANAGKIMVLLLVVGLTAVGCSKKSSTDSKPAKTPQTQSDKNTLGGTLDKAVTDAGKTVKDAAKKATDTVAKVAAKMQTKCPVMGNDIDKNIYVDYKGHRIYFCCDACKEKFNADPEKYIKQLEAEGITLAKAGQ